MPWHGYRLKLYNCFKPGLFPGEKADTQDVGYLSALIETKMHEPMANVALYSCISVPGETAMKQPDPIYWKAYKSMKAAMRNETDGPLAYDNIAAVLRLLPQPSVGMGEDLVWLLSKKISELEPKPAPDGTAVVKEFTS